MVLAYLCFAIIYRRKTKNSAKIISKILNDILLARSMQQGQEKNLEKQSLNRDVDVDLDYHIFNNYEDYKRIRNFYLNLRDMRSYILNHDIPDNQRLKKYSKDCLNYANEVYKIKWLDYYRFDYIIALPLIIHGSFFITLVCKGIPFLYWPIPDFETFCIFSFILRSIAAFFMVKEIVKVSNEIDVGKARMFVLAVGIMGIPESLIWYVKGLALFSFYINNYLYLSIVVYVSDIARIILLVWIISYI